MSSSGHAQTSHGRLVEFELEGEITTDQMIDMLYGEVADAYRTGEDAALSEENLTQVIREFLDEGNFLDEDLALTIVFHPRVPRWWVEQILDNPEAAGLAPDEVDLEEIARHLASNHYLPTDLLERIYSQYNTSSVCQFLASNPNTPTPITEAIAADVLRSPEPKVFSDPNAATAMGLYENLSMSDQTGRDLTAWLEHLLDGNRTSRLHVTQHYRKYVMPYPNRRAWLSDAALSHMLVDAASK